MLNVSTETGRLCALLLFGVALAVVANLPVVELPGRAEERFGRWAIFTGGLLAGVALTRLRAVLR